MVSADAPLQIGCEVTGRRGTLESWREGPDADHAQIKIFLGLEGANQRTLKERERQPSRRAEPQGNGHLGVARQF